MIDFMEKFFPDGSISTRVVADGLPAGMFYHVHLWHDGRCTAKSRGYGNGSVRYYSHATYEEGLAHGFAWAKRRVAEAKRNRSITEEA